MFGPAGDVAALRRAWAEWSTMNHVRSAVVLASLLCQVGVLSRIERLGG